MDAFEGCESTPIDTEEELTTALMCIQYETLVHGFLRFKRHFEPKYGPLTAFDPYTRMDFKEVKDLYPVKSVPQMLKDVFEIAGYPATVLTREERMEVLRMVLFYRKLLTREDPPTWENVKTYNDVPLERITE